MTKLNTLLAAVLLAVSGMAHAEITLYNPISMPPAGYEQGCDVSYLKIYSYSGYFGIPQLKDGEVYYVYTGFSNPYPIACSQGLLSTNAASSTGYLTYYYD